MMPSTLICNNCGATNQPQAAYCRSCGSSLQAVNPTMYHSTTGRLLANVTLRQHYRIVAPLGKGGMGAVYKAKDTQLGNRPVALKEMSQNSLSPQERKEAADAFRQEALLLAHLHHPNLPTIFEHFEENGRWYLVMSFIEGETLQDYLSHARGGKLPLDEVLQIGIQLCTVLGYLHTQQPAIIFRDLKPANSMRTPDGHVYLIDFGIARHFKPGQARDTAYYGSVGYAPPEQFGRAQTTPRSDIYSLGATLYQLLSGHDPSSTPFRFPPLQSLVPTAPAGLTTLITQMLEMDEDKRPASMLVVKQELQRLASSAAQQPQQLTPLAPTVPAKSNHGLTPSGPTQPSGPQVQAPPVQSPAKSTSMWAFGKSQLVATLILAVCYTIVSYLVLFQLLPHSPSPVIANFEVSFIVFLPLYFASFFGPWVGIAATGIGFLLAEFIGARQGDLFLNPPWWTIFLLMPAAFFAGLFLLKTKGQYQSFGNLLFATLLGLLIISVSFIVYDSIYTLIYPFLDRFSTFPTDIWSLNLPALIFLPLLLLISSAIRNENIRKHP